MFENLFPMYDDNLVDVVVITLTSNEYLLNIVFTIASYDVVLRKDFVK